MSGTQLSDNFPKQQLSRGTPSIGKLCFKKSSGTPSSDKFRKIMIFWDAPSIGICCFNKLSGTPRSDNFHQGLSHNGCSNLVACHIGMPQMCLVVWLVCLLSWLPSCGSSRHALFVLMFVQASASAADL